MKCQKNKACVKQPGGTTLPKDTRFCTGCDKTGKDKVPRKVTWFVLRWREHGRWVKCETLFRSRRAAHDRMELIGWCRHRVDPKGRKAI